MFSLKNIQENLNKKIAEYNKKIVLKKLENYYRTIYFDKNINYKEYAINAFWEAKRRKRLDNLNRIVKSNFANRDRT